MAQYRKKPVVVEAVQFKEVSRTEFENGTHIEYNSGEISDFLGKIVRLKTTPNGVPEGGKTIEIDTLEGVMTASVGDYIIKGIKGEFYPCKPDIFEATYEPVDEEICFQTCESCGNQFDITIMETDSDGNWFCPECWEELAPVMAQEYRELVAKGEIEED